MRTAFVRFAAIGALAAFALAGCSNDPLAEQYRDGNSKGYISGDGTISEIKPANRTLPVEFSGTTAAGTSVSSLEFIGTVVVVNFWYANCPPCRVEAPVLERLSVENKDNRVAFVGVNVRDQAEAVATFERAFGVTYPSIVDSDGTTQLAFAGEVSPRAVPTTIILDKHGRVAARILGKVAEPSILQTLIRDRLAEASPNG